MREHLELKVLPREIITWEEFLKQTPENSIALDGVVSGGPAYNESTRHVNFDHHDSVVRDATMSTCMQVYHAIKGGLFQSFRENGKPRATVYVNDPDQDTAMAVWLLDAYQEFEGTMGNPRIHRLLALNDRLDITGGGFPMNLRDDLVEQHEWVFEPYAELRKSGELASADAAGIGNCIEAVAGRLYQFAMGDGGRKPLDTRHEIIFEKDGFKVYDEIGGSSVRWHLFSKGMDAFATLIAKRPDGNSVMSIGRRSQYIPFDVIKTFEDLNKIEGFSGKECGWGGSGLVGGSDRKYGTSLSLEEVGEVAVKNYKSI